MPRYLSAGQLCGIAGISAPSLESLVRDGAVVPAIAGDGRGVSRKYTASQALAISMGRWLRQSKGWPMHAALNVMRALLCIPDEKLNAAIADRRRYLVLLGGTCAPILWR